MAGYKVKILDKAGNFVASISTEAESPEKAISNVRKNWAQVKFEKDPIALAIHKTKAKYLFVPQEIRPEPKPKPTPEPVAPAKSPLREEQLELFSRWVADNCRFAKRKKRRKRRRKETEEGAAGTGGSNNGGSMSLNEKNQIEIGIFAEWVKGNCKFAAERGAQPELDDLFEEMFNAPTREEVSRERKSEKMTIELLRGLDVDESSLERKGDKLILSPAKSEQGVMWFAHRLQGYYDPEEYVTGRGSHVLRYPLETTKHYDLVTYDDGTTTEERPEDIPYPEPTENQSMMCDWGRCLELPDGFKFSYKAEKWIICEKELLISPGMLSRDPSDEGESEVEEAAGALMVSVGIGPMSEEVGISRMQSWVRWNCKFASGIDDFEAMYSRIEPLALGHPEVQQEMRERGSLSIKTTRRLFPQLEEGEANFFSRIFNNNYHDVGASRAADKREKEAFERERVDEYYYHVTTADRLDDVMEHGLNPGAAPMMENYAGYSGGKLFLTEKGGIDFWKSRVGDHVFHMTGEEIPVVVLRVPKAAVGDMSDDEIGTEDAKNPSYFVTEPIDASLLEIVEGPSSATAWVAKNCKFAALRGEWWIDDSGFAEYADGDIGDQNHEAIALGSAFGIHEDSWTQLEADNLAKEMLEDPTGYQDVFDDLGVTPEALASEEYDKRGMVDYFIRALEDLYSYQFGPKQIVALKSINGDLDAIDWFIDNPGKDARTWAMEHSGWIRVAGNNFQLWQYDASARSRISGFLAEEAEEEDWESEITINEFASGNVFSFKIKDLIPQSEVRYPEQGAREEVRQRQLPLPSWMYS